VKLGQVAAAAGGILALILWSRWNAHDAGYNGIALDRGLTLPITWAEQTARAVAKAVGNAAGAVGGALWNTITPAPSSTAQALFGSAEQAANDINYWIHKMH
jgi:hypothetical protein